MSVNQTKARELTEDWLHKWRSLESDEDKVTNHTYSSRCSEIGVQTSLPFLIDDPADLIPVKEDKLENNWRPEELLNISDNDSWSDDSLDGSYPSSKIVPEKNRQSFTESFIMSKPITQELTDVKSVSQIEESFTSLWPESYQQRRSPMPTSQRRINARKILKTRPDVRTIFSYQEDDHRSRLPTTPTIVFHPPSADSDDAKETLADPRDRTIYSGSKILYTPPSSQAHDVPSKLEGEVLLAKLNFLINKMAISGSQESYCNQNLWPIHRNIQPERKSGMAINTAHCCHVNCHQGDHSKIQHCQVHHHHYQRYNHRCPIHQPVTSSLSFEAMVRLELLAIRRRMVARTASPKVINSLPYLRQWQSNSPHCIYDKNCHCQQNLPGEIWV